MSRFKLAEYEATFDRNRFIHYKELTDSFTQGSLLSQIAYWYLPSKTGASKLKVEKFGEQWIAKPREEWMEECNLTPKQYRNALVALQDYNLIVTRQALFGQLNITHIFLNIDNLVEWVGPTGVVPKGLLGWAQKAHLSGTKWATSGGPKGPTLMNKSITTDTTQSTTQSDLTVVPSPAKKFSTGVGQKQIPNSEKNVKAQDVVSQHKAGKLVDGKKAKFIWLQAMAEIMGHTQQPLTGKQVGQLRQIMMASEGNTDFLRWVLDHWASFGQEVMANHAVHKYPAIPDLGFLLVYKNDALGMWLQSIAPKPKMVVNAPVSEFAEQTQTVYAASKETTPEEPPLPSDWWANILEKTKPKDD